MNNENKTEIDKERDLSPFKNWIKLIPFERLVNLGDYPEKEKFLFVADIILDNEVFTKGKNKGVKKRDTVIKFIPKINKKDFDEDSEWLYIFTINGKIVKIGGTRTGLKGRVSSYISGHHTKERGKSGYCSKTNGFIYNTFEFYLKFNYEIKMYGYKLPDALINLNILNKNIPVKAQTYHAYESCFLEDYKQKYNEYPILNDNCDPDYKT